MLESAIKEYQKYLSTLAKSEDAPNKRDLFNADGDQARKVSIQVCLFKIPNIMNEKRILW